MKEPWSFSSQEECVQSWGESAFAGGEAFSGKWCNATWDTVLCWPGVPAGSTVYLPCPPLPGLDHTQKGFRKCSPEGRWEGRPPVGYSNYTECYHPESRKLIQKFYENKSVAERQMMKDIVVGTRTMEIIGLWISLVASLVSLFIFSYFRSLRCHRTRIHRNLLIAIIVQTIIRLILYLDQYIAREKQADMGALATGTSGALFHTPVFCEIIYTLLEYTKSVQFMWMLVEGIYLHNMIAVSVFYGKPNYFVYYTIGWGTAVPFTLVWVGMMVHLFNHKCWFPYYFLPYYWIIEAPRVAVIAINLVFLLNIIRVLITKLRKTHTQEPQVTKVKKAVKAAIVLLPLLGITNFVVMTEAPADHVVRFGVWMYSTYFLISFQGFFISLLYCFLNGEVQDTLKRHLCFSHHMRWENSLKSIRLYPLPKHGKVQMTIRKHWEQFRQSRRIGGSSFRRLSRSFSVFTSVSEVPQNNGHQRRPSQQPPGFNAVPLLRDTGSKTESRL